MEKKLLQMWAKEQKSSGKKLPLKMHIMSTMQLFWRRKVLLINKIIMDISYTIM